VVAARESRPEVEADAGGEAVAAAAMVPPGGWERRRDGMGSEAARKGGVRE
jgi:hypothetical protein